MEAHWYPDSLASISFRDYYRIIGKKTLSIKEADMLWLIIVGLYGIVIPIVIMNRRHHADDTAFKYTHNSNIFCESTRHAS